MSFLSKNFHRYANSTPFKTNMTLSTARLAKKKIDPFVEAKTKDKKNPENLNPLKPESLKEKIKNKFIRDFVPFAIGMGICGYMLYLMYKKRKESLQLDELNKDQIYLEKEKLDSIDDPNGNLNIPRFIKLNKIKSFPYNFIQITNLPKNAQSKKFRRKEPHLHYYKLNHLLNRENIEMSLSYLNLNELKENQLRKLCKIFGVAEADFLTADYFISNKLGEFAFFSEQNPKTKNFDSIKNFLIGIQTVSNLKELKQIINSLTEETITVLTSEAKNKNSKSFFSNDIANKIFIENAGKFSNVNTYNFLQANANFGNLKIAENEIIVFLNKQVYEVNENLDLPATQGKIVLKLNDGKSTDLHVQFVFEKFFPNLEKFYGLKESLFKEDKESFENSEDNDVILFKEEIANEKIEFKLEDDYLIALRITFPENKSESDDFKAYVEFVKKFLNEIIKIDGNKNNKNSLSNNKDSKGFTDSKIININNNSNLTYNNLIHRRNYTDNIDIAIFNKLNYFADKDKVLILYLNNNNLNFSESSSNRNLISNIKNQLHELIEKLKKDFPNIKFIFTSNPNIFNLFNLLPSAKENISIRYLDYSKYAYFSKNQNKNSSSDYEIFSISKSLNLNNNQNDLSEALNNKDRNLIFNFKTNFSEYADKLNYESLKAFISESQNLNESNGKSNVKPYLECADAPLGYLEEQIKQNIKNLNSQNFQTEILSGKNLRNLVLLYNKDCNGCQKTEALLNDLLEETKFDKEEIKFYRYNTLNESVHFKKFRNVPAAVLIENGRIVKEIDLKKVIEENENHDAAIKRVFEALINKESYL